MPKLTDWETRLTAQVTQAHSRPFAWGSHDCCLWAADCVQAQTGIDHAADVRGTYATARESVAVLDGMGGLEGVGERLGKSIPPLMATHGDIGIVEIDGRDMLALCNGDHWLVCATHGLVTVSLEMASCAWKVAHG